MTLSYRIIIHLSIHSLFHSIPIEYLLLPVTTIGRAKNIMESKTKPNETSNEQNYLPVLDLMDLVKERH